RGEWLLAAANARLQAALEGVTRGSTATTSVEEALRMARDASVVLPDDPRPIQSASVALLLLHRGEEAIALLEPAIESGERPELTINLGRARGIVGDEAGASRAFLRTAWANPEAIRSLPKAMREPLLARVKELEQDLNAGGLQQPPPL
ncbi:MAG TPA: hypothetical protein VF132_05630, partial [Rudaea sp.]